MRLRPILAIAPLLSACSTQAPPAASRSPVEAPKGAVEVVLGRNADDPFSVHEPKSAVAVRVSLVGARRVGGETRRDVTVYPDALGAGVHVEHHARADGTEDFVRFPARPSSESLRYRVDVAGVAGLRMVKGSDTLELLDASGAPRLRMAPPYGLSASGKRFPASARVEGCAIDESAAPPWGRPVTPPGAATCDVVVSWQDAKPSYPATIDPAWVVTTSMSVGRANHTATRLADGRLLVVGGSYDKPSSAELFDPATKTWAGVGPTVEPRGGHTAALLSDGRVIVVGGSQSIETTSTELYAAATGAFSKGPAMSVARTSQAMAQLPSGGVAVVGGSFVSGSTLEVLDATAKAWASVATLSTRHSQTMVALADGRLLVAGGETSFGFATDVVLVDASTGAKTAVGALAEGCVFPMGARLADGSVVLAGGNGFNGVVATATRWTPGPAGSPGTLSPITPLPFGRGGGRVVGTPTGGVLIVGGWGDLGPLGDVLLFDPVKGSWTPAGGLVQARSVHTATKLADGSLLVAGGNDGVAGTLASVEVCSDGVCAQVPCATKSDCDAGLGCSAGFCVTPGPIGNPCADGQGCASGICAQGVCCESTCDGPCISCNAKDKAGTPSGTCGPVAEGQNPAKACTASGGECGVPAACDGYGNCAGKAPFGQYCAQGTTTCTAGQLFLSQCDGNGACVPSLLEQPCSPAKTCAGTGCGPNTCTDDSGCAAAYTCKQGKCVGKQGTYCADGTPCASGSCSSGVCCDKACDGACETCDGATPGTCTLRPKGTTLTSCFQPSCVCDAMTCDGVTPTAHFVGAETKCSSLATCSTDGTGYAGTCDGAGACALDPTPIEQPCFPFGCTGNGTSAACLVFCDLPAYPCATGATCKSSGFCVPNPPPKDAGVDASDDGGVDAGDDGGIDAGATGGQAGKGGAAGGGGGGAAGAKAGSAGSVAGVSSTGPGGASSATPSAGDSGCGCRVAGNAPLPPAWLALVAIAVAARRRRSPAR